MSCSGRKLALKCGAESHFPEMRIYPRQYGRVWGLGVGCHGKIFKRSAADGLRRCASARDLSSVKHRRVGQDSHLRHLAIWHPGQRSFAGMHSPVALDARSERGGLRHDGRHPPDREGHMAWNKTTQEQDIRPMDRLETDLTGEERAVIEPLVPPPGRIGRTRQLCVFSAAFSCDGLQQHNLPFTFAAFPRSHAVRVPASNDMGLRVEEARHVPGASQVLPVPGRFA